MVIFDYIGEEENGNLTDRFTFPFSANRVIEVAEEKELIMRSCSAVNKLIRRELWKESGFQFPKGRYMKTWQRFQKFMTKTKKDRVLAGSLLLLSYARRINYAQQKF